MWWQRRNLGVSVLACMLVLGLSACGLHPMYGDHATEDGSKSALQGNILIPKIDNSRFGQLLKADLEDKFNPEGLTNAHPDYTLKIDIKRSLIPSVVRSDGTILRYDLRFETNYRLINNTIKIPEPTAAVPHPIIPKGAVFTGVIRRASSYNVVPNANYATYEAEEDLNKRMLDEVAEDYVLRISGHLAGQ